MAWIWMRHTDHGGVARFNAEVERAYAARGWERCEPPTDEDEPSVGATAPREVAVSVTASEVGKTFTQAMKRASHETRRRGGHTAQED